MKKRVLFFYLMKNNPDLIQQIIPDHITFWMNQNLEKYTGSPFADRSGGLIITFLSDSLDVATEII